MIEVDLARQVVLVMADGRVRAVLNASTGSGFTYVQDGQVHVAATPTGRFAVSRLVDGWDHSDLGWLWRPAYFSGGFALHGSTFVPSYPDSHGCVRLSIAAMNWLLDSGLVGLGTEVLIY